MNRKAPLPGQGGRGTRERQSVWCCGRSYQRWRFLGRDFPGTHHTHCVMCGKVLAFPEKRLQLGAELRRLDRKRIELAAYHRRAEKFELSGLTRHGAKPQGGHGRVPRTDLELAWRKERAAMGTIEVNTLVENGRYQ